MMPHRIRSYTLELFAHSRKSRVRHFDSTVPAFLDLPLPLPPEIVEWTTFVAGAESTDARFFGIGGQDPWLDMRAALSVFPHWVDARWYPLADDYFGGYYVLRDQPRIHGRPSIVFMNGSYSDARHSTYIATDIWIFVCRLLSQSADHELPTWVRHALEEDQQLLNQFAALEPPQDD